MSPKDVRRQLLGVAISNTKMHARGVGRPHKLVTDEATLGLVRWMGEIRATQRECAKFLGVALTTFERFLTRPGVREAFEKGEATALISLRRSQFKLAETNAQMAIHLGKVYLRQGE